MNQKRLSGININSSRSHCYKCWVMGHLVTRTYTHRIEPDCFTLWCPWPATFWILFCNCQNEDPNFGLTMKSQSKTSSECQTQLGEFNLWVCELDEFDPRGGLRDVIPRSNNLDSGMMRYSNVDSRTMRLRSVNTKQCELEDLLWRGNLERHIASIF